MCRQLEELVKATREVVGEFDCDNLHAQRALEAVEFFAEVERLAAAGRMLAARRVQQTGAWRSTGASSAVAWLADKVGGTFSQAAGALTVAAHIDELPHLRESLVEGCLSETKAIEIAGAAIVDHSAEAALVAMAQEESLAALRERCRDVRAAAIGDEDRSERIRRGRYLKEWSDRDGAVRMDVRLAPEDAAPFLAVVRTRAERFQAQARRAGLNEPPHAYAADALLSLIKGADEPKAIVHVHVSATALERGHTVAGETSRISGVGPITVSAAKRFIDSSAVRIIETDGVDVQRVAHTRRSIPAHIRSALEARDETCVVPGCNRRNGLEIDHITPIAEGGLTSLQNLARLCKWHHTQKTHHGWNLGGGPGKWSWERLSKAQAPP